MDTFGRVGTWEHSPTADYHEAVEKKEVLAGLDTHSGITGVLVFCLVPFGAVFMACSALEVFKAWLQKIKTE